MAPVIHQPLYASAAPVLDGSPSAIIAREEGATGWPSLVGGWWLAATTNHPLPNTDEHVPRYWGVSPAGQRASLDANDVQPRRELGERKPDSITVTAALALE